VSGESETMRLIAEVVDKFSGPLKDLNKAIGTVNAAGKRLHDDGAKQTREHAKAYKELHERIGKTKEMVAGTLSPAMAALGLTTFGVGEALGKVVDKLKEVGAQYNIMQDVSRRAGMSVDHVRALSVGFERLGISTDVANNAAAEFGEHMDKLKRGNGEELASWTTKLGGAYQALGASLRSIPTREGQLGAVFDFFSSHPNIPVDQKRKFYEEILHLPPELATKTGEELKAALAAGMTWANDHPDNEGLGKGLSAAFSDLREAMAGFQEDMVETFGGPGIALVKGFAAAIKELGKDIKEAEPFSGKTPEVLNNGVWDKANPVLKWFADPHLPSLQDLKDRAYSNPDGSKEPPTSKPGTLQWSLPKDPFKGGPLDGYHPAAFTTGGGGGSGSSQAEQMLSNGVKTGMLAAFREWFAATSSKGGGYQKANYSDGPPSSTKSAADIAASFGNRDFPNGAGGGRGAPDGEAASIGGGRSGDVGAGRSGGRGRGAPDGDGAGAGPTSVAPSENNDASLDGGGGAGINRDKWLAQLNANPALKEELFRHAYGENSDPKANQAVMEEAANRADIRGAKGFSDKGNLSYFQGYNRNFGTKARAMMEANFDKVFRQGSDISNGAIDNSSQGLAYTNQHGGAMGGYGWAGKKPGRFRTTANFGGDGITGHRGVESFEAPGWGESGRGEAARYPEFRKNQLAEAALRRDRMTHSVKGDASLNIALDGFPKGTKTDLTYGGLFTSYNLSRGRQMEQSEQK
jgi:hypothetical protein